MLKMKWRPTLLGVLLLFLSANLSDQSQSFSVQGTSLAFSEEPQKQVDEYAAVADRAIEALMRGDAAGFKALLSPVTIKMEQRGATAVDTIIEQKFIPFFKEYSKPGVSQQSFRTYRSIDGVKGVGLARSFTAKDGTLRFFVIFILDERGSLVVGNLLLDKKIEDVR